MKDASCGHSANNNYHFGDSSLEAKDGEGLPEMLQRLAKENKDDEQGQSAPCEACGERTVDEVKWCLGTDTPSTAYCVGNHKKGCLLKISGRCLGHTTKMICARCGAVQGE